MNEPVRITWLGHSCFRMEYRGWALVTDPYADGMVPGLPPLRTAAGAVYCSHEHDDHNARTCVRITRQAPPPDFAVEAEIDCPHDGSGGRLRGRSIARVFRFGALRVAHLGDLGVWPEPDVLRGAAACDALLLPVGGYYTIDAAAAAAAVRDLRPRVFVPMHYRGEDFGFPVLGTLDAFAAAFGEKTALAGPDFLLTAESPAGLVIPAR